MKASIAAIANYYQKLAAILLTTFLLLVAVNAIIWICLLPPRVEKKRQVATAGSLFNVDGSPVDNGKRTPGQLSSFDFRAYESVTSEQYASEVLDGFYGLSRLGFQYQSWVQFSEPPFNSKLVNIDKDEYGIPYRRTISPISREQVFVFGGSTTFGYQVSDEHTWPTYLSKILNKDSNNPIEIRNYGRGYYYPSQEVMLFLHLLRLGARPKMAIFFDGLNWGMEDDSPQFTETLTKQFYYRQFRPRLANLPMLRMVNTLSEEMKEYLDARKPIDKKGLDFVAKEVFKSNRALAIEIGKMYGVKTVFFLQPDPVFNYSQSLHRFQHNVKWIRWQNAKILFYPMMKDSGYIDLTGLMTVWPNRRVIIDEVHYSPNFNKLVAEHVAENIRR